MEPEKGELLRALRAFCAVRNVQLDEGPLATLDIPLKDGSILYEPVLFLELT